MMTNRAADLYHQMMSIKLDGEPINSISGVVNGRFASLSHHYDSVAFRYFHDGKLHIVEITKKGQDFEVLVSPPLVNPGYYNRWDRCSSLEPSSYGLIPDVEPCIDALFKDRTSTDIFELGLSLVQVQPGPGIVPVRANVGGQNYCVYIGEKSIEIKAPKTYIKTSVSNIRWKGCNEGVEFPEEVINALKTIASNSLKKLSA